MRKQKLGPFGEIFIKSMDTMEADCKALGINLTVLCKEARVSRAGPVRWRIKVPATVRLMDRMLRALERHKAKAGAAP